MDQEVFRLLMWFLLLTSSIIGIAWSIKDLD
nr:MAG: hypothetical protein [Bacteriophage sp.]UWD70813.1 MAG: hypothetical protein [Bacteriophage sp.]UWI28004.1 MAG: hypothetical protein [Bacteriophage sp.]DAK84044.1 MAG TPA: hypothetical protein [Caudoviricetes sp.]